MLEFTLPADLFGQDPEFVPPERPDDASKIWPYYLGDDGRIHCPAWPWGIPYVPQIDDRDLQPEFGYPIALVDGQRLHLGSNGLSCDFDRVGAPIYEVPGLVDFSEGMAPGSFGKTRVTTDQLTKLAANAGHAELIDPGEIIYHAIQAGALATLDGADFEMEPDFLVCPRWLIHAAFASRHKSPASFGDEYLTERDIGFLAALDVFPAFISASGRKWLHDTAGPIIAGRQWATLEPLSDCQPWALGCQLSALGVLPVWRRSISLDQLAATTAAAFPEISVTPGVMLQAASRHGLPVWYRARSAGVWIGIAAQSIRDLQRLAGSRSAGSGQCDAFCPLAGKVVAHGREPYLANTDHAEELCVSELAAGRQCGIIRRVIEIPDEEIQQAITQNEQPVSSN